MPLTSRRHFLLETLAAASVAVTPRTGHADTPTVAAQHVPASRQDWLQLLERVSEPVLHHMANGTLQQAMPVEAAPGQKADRTPGTYLEAFGRLIAGLAPWLELTEDDSTSTAEQKLRQRYQQAVLEGLVRGCDPHAASYLNFGATAQTLVDSSFLALALLRAPKQLLQQIPQPTRQALANALRQERSIHPPNNNWLLFAAMNEATLHAMGEDWSMPPVETALTRHQEWYLGDGTYGDGPHLHWDYYNSFVIQPYLLQIFDTLGPELPQWKEFAAAEQKRAERYAVIQERLIGTDGTYPATGRSITYRCGAFHLLADATLRGLLPASLPANQVRCALSAVLQRTLTPPQTFDRNGWLQIGLAGHQPALGETYISTGSLYLCANAFLPLGLSAQHPFWSGPNVPWSSQQIWSGKDHVLDHKQDD